MAGRTCNLSELENRVYKIGTRGSLLAVTQCQQIKKELEEKTGLKFELELIKTQGDLDTSVPLWQMEGKDFFTKELDDALLKKKVDLVVHSYKDLGSLRPEGIYLAAITRRSFANDILLIRKDVQKQMSRNEFNQDFIVGTSSPRRIVNSTQYLGRILPTENILNITTKMLRGNVNTRIEKLKNGDYHAIILAMAGLERLAQDKEAREKLSELLNDLNFTILPQKIFPSAASQGALGIECRKEDKKLQSLLALVNDSDTIDEVEREREHFQRFGGGCHLAVGINVRKFAGLYIHSLRGEVDHKEVKVLKTEGIEEKFKNAIAKQKGTLAFFGMPETSKDEAFKDFIFDKLIIKKAISGEHELIHSQRKIFVTTSYAQQRLPQESRMFSLWAAGSMTWQKLARKGHWFHGCSEGLGHEEIHRLSSSSEIIKLLLKINFENVSENKYTVLTHNEANSKLGPVVYSYEREILEDIDNEYKTQVEECFAFYWTSRKQAEIFLEKFPHIKDKAHFCGLGKTYYGLKEMELNPIALSSPSEYKNLITPYLNNL